MRSVEECGTPQNLLGLLRRNDHSCRGDDVEDYDRAIEVLERVRQGREPVYSAAEVRKDLGLGDWVMG